MQFDDGEKDAFRGPAIIGYLVKELQEKHPEEQQIGRTKIQKTLYLLRLKHVVGCDYTMHCYGPYSAEVSNDLSIAERAEVIKVDWKDDEGFFIEKGINEERFEQSYLKKAEKQAIDEIVREFGAYNARKYTILATSLFLKDKKKQSNKDDLVDMVHKVKKYPTSEIRAVVDDSEKAGYLAFKKIK